MLLVLQFKEVIAKADPLAKFWDPLEHAHALGKELHPAGTQSEDFFRDDEIVRTVFEAVCAKVSGTDARFAAVWRSFLACVV